MNATAVALICGIFATAMADWWINGDGTGFVGKGDVQSVYGWNDHDLQANAGLVMFRASVMEVSEVSWVCTNSNNNNTQVRTRTTTSSGASDLLHEIRLNSQGHVTGFNLLGWAGVPNFTTTHDGPPLNSCPSGPWSLTQPAGAPTIISNESTGQVSIDAEAWLDLPALP
jgi:hypothetical protein